MEKLTNLDHLRAASLAAKGLIGEVAGATAEALGELAEELEELAAQQGGSSSQTEGNIPSGGIIIWSGAADAVPAGWALCDGENGTPDLRNRFVLGAGSSYAVGATGGEATHKLTTTEMPIHSHIQTARTSNSSSASTNKRLLYTGGANQVYSGCTPATATATNGSGGYQYTDTAGGGTSHNNMPPYYALCYIMKL